MSKQRLKTLATGAIERPSGEIEYTIRGGSADGESATILITYEAELAAPRPAPVRLQVTIRDDLHAFIEAVAREPELYRAFMDVENTGEVYTAF